MRFEPCQIFFAMILPHGNFRWIAAGHCCKWRFGWPPYYLHNVWGSIVLLWMVNMLLWSASFPVPWDLANTGSIQNARFCLNGHCMSRFWYLHCHFCHNNCNKNNCIFVWKWHFLWHCYLCSSYCDCIRDNQIQLLYWTYNEMKDQVIKPIKLIEYPL